MIRIYPAAERFSVDLGWLKSWPSFSFGSYQDPDNTGFGVMRVCNDDTVAPGRGFGAHPHSDMEIVSVILEGAIRHEDNLGNVEISSAGQVQRISAGTGVIHAEYNPSDAEPLSLLQLWFMPQQRGLPPSYETGRYDQEKLNNALFAVVTPTGAGGPATVHQDLTIYLSRLEAGRSVTHEQPEGRKLFLYVMEGNLIANGEKLSRRDSARIEDVQKLAMEAEQDAYIMLIDLP